MKYFKKITATIIICLLFICIGNGQGNLRISDLKLDKKFEVLKGRACLNFPDKAFELPRESGIMGPATNPYLETRIIFDTGDCRMVFLAQEMFVRGNSDTVLAIGKLNEQNKKYTCKAKTLTNTGKLFSVLSTPIVYPDSASGATVINSLMAKTEDGTLFRVQVYINPSGYKQKQEFIKLSENICKTLSPGTRSNHLNHRFETDTVFLTKSRFVFDIPENYCVMYEYNPYGDFGMYQFHRYQYSSDTNWVDLIFYSGRYPDRKYFESAGLDSAKVKHTAGTFVGKSVRWLEFYDEYRHSYIKEQLIRLPDSGQDVHVGMSSNTQQGIEELTKIVEAVKFER